MEWVARWVSLRMGGWGEEVVEVGVGVGRKELLGLGGVGGGGGRGGCVASGYARVADW